MRAETKRRKPEPVEARYGSLSVGVCKFCAGETILAKGRHKAYMFCINCDKVYKVEPAELLSNSKLLV